MSGESEIFKLSRLNWLRDEVSFDENLVLKIYQDQILRHGFSHKQIQALEFTQYFEKYLWPNFAINQYKCERQYIISICAIINEKLSEKVNPWECFLMKSEKFTSLFQNVLELIITKIDDNSNKKWLEKIVLIQFLNNCFLSMTEFDFIFNEIKYLMSLGMWSCLSSGRLQKELSRNKEYKHKYGKLIKSDARSENHVKFKRVFLPNFLDSFLSLIDDDKNDDILSLRYAENCILLLINLESMLVSRRYLNAIIDDKHVVVRTQNCALIRRFDDTRLFNQMIEMLDLYANFEIDEASGSTLTDSQLECHHREKLMTLKREAFVRFKEPMRELWLSNCRRLEDKESLRGMLKEQSVDDLNSLAVVLGLVNEQESRDEDKKEELIDMFCYSYKKRVSTLNRLNNLPLYPSEKLIYDENQIPEGYFSVEDNFAIPKLSMQYLSFHDYLMRNFELFRLEASYEIKQDIEQCLAMMKPVIDEKEELMFQGWSRMALVIENFEIVEVGKPEIGRSYPRVVKADVSVVLSQKEAVRGEWESLAKHDPCFLITVAPKLRCGEKYNNRESMASQLANLVVRGCEIEGLLDKEGRVMTEEERRTKGHGLGGQARTWRVRLDPCQYQGDVIDDSNDKKEDVYGSFNVFLRRKPKENNFKAVLETIRDLMNDRCVVPDWLQDLLLGYDQPTAAHYSAMTSQYIQSLNWADTFLSLEHLEHSFPQYQVETKGGERDIAPPFRLTFPTPLEDATLKPIQMHEDYSVTNQERPRLLVEPVKTCRRLPAMFIDSRRWTTNDIHSLSSEPCAAPGNRIPFTPTQVEAIRSGMQQGLTLVVGPPGTGKTDIAVQIISNIYKNFPNQRTLIVTHSNQALNQLFEKIMGLEVEERHLLRLGHGEEALETEKDMSKYGRVNYVLARRLELLWEVQRLSTILLGNGTCDDISKDSRNDNDGPLYTCETAQHFLLSEVMPRWVSFLSDFPQTSDTTAAHDHDNFVSSFPFLDFFIPKKFQTERTLGLLFPGNCSQEDREASQACFRHLLDMFVQLDDFRSFELMRNGLSRANSLLVQHARIIAMTCTHAALRRRELIQLGFTYDNILIEEAAQILEIETFIPLLLQGTDQSGLNRLKRFVMIGDHNQLPPVIKNTVLHHYCNMAQSMFARLVKLGVPAVQLNAQGRSRSSMVALYGWRYRALADLPVIARGREYAAANPGLLHDFQLVDVPDYLGHGESEPTPHFLQNLAEAEYSVGLYMYMRALGYPAHTITILTTYNGQKHLIRDVIRNRCADIGAPSKVTTVDRFQGQQNDYIILSLVRTKSVGHLRDVRRLVVALSRARLGLYIFCRTSLFAQCRELQRSFGPLLARSTDLALVSGEHYSFVDRFIKGENVKVRLADQYPDNSSSSVSFMKDVQHMTQYVHTIYTAFKKSLANKKRTLEIDYVEEVVQKRQKVEEPKKMAEQTIAINEVEMKEISEKAISIDDEETLDVENVDETVEKLQSIEEEQHAVDESEKMEMQAISIDEVEMKEICERSNSNETLEVESVEETVEKHPDIGEHQKIVEEPENIYQEPISVDNKDCCEKSISIEGEKTKEIESNDMEQESILITPEID